MFSGGNIVIAVIDNVKWYLKECNQHHETDEILEKNLLIAVRNCGNIDLDGGEGDNINMEDDVRPSDDGPVHRGEQVAYDEDERRPEIPSWD